jgi:transposase
MIDPATGMTLYKQKYIDRLKAEGKSTDEMRIWNDKRRVPAGSKNVSSFDAVELTKEILSTVKDYGVTYFLQAIAQKINLIEVLEQSIPQNWQKIFVLACYLVAEDKSLMYCEDWVADNDCLDAGNMASQRISELLTEFGCAERTEFYRLWYSHIRENEYIALDITSVSSYSENIEFMEWGYNRDGDALPQVNICMLFGETSLLPIYQTTYSGSLGDVSTLETTLGEFSAITGTKDISLVMDKGFFSTHNVNIMLDPTEKSAYRFLIPISFTCKFAKRHVANEKEKIDDIDNIIFTSGSPIRGVCRDDIWGKKHSPIHTHIFFNTEKAVKDRNKLYNYVAELKMLATEKPNDKNHQKVFRHYLDIQTSSKDGEALKVGIRKDILEKELEFSGWFVLISNHLSDPQVAYDIYRAKDVVEKSFFHYKNNLGLNRFHVHSDERLLNKQFIAFVALILTSYIHNIMKKTKLDKQFYFGKLLSVLSKLKVASVNGISVLRPLSKDQKLIFKSFCIDNPAGNEE